MKCLLIPIKNSRRHFTTDNWYTSIPRITCAEDYALEYTEEKKLKFLTSPGKMSLQYLDFNNKMLVVYVSQKIRLLSTLYYDYEIDLDISKLPIIQYYYYSVRKDAVDKMCVVYSVTQITRRWPSGFLHFNAYWWYKCSNSIQKCIFRKSSNIPQSILEQFGI